jgi:hypothetical protein
LYSVLRNVQSRREFNCKDVIANGVVKVNCNSELAGKMSSSKGNGNPLVINGLHITVLTTGRIGDAETSI